MKRTESTSSAQVLKKTQPEGVLRGRRSLPCLRDVRADGDDVQER